MNARNTIVAGTVAFAIAAGLLAPTGAANAAPLLKAPVAALDTGPAGVIEVGVKKKKVVVHVHRPYYGYGYYPYPYPYLGGGCGVKKVKIFKPGVGIKVKTKRVCW